MEWLIYAILLSNNSQLCWMLHVVACCCELLRKVLKPVKPLATCKRTQQLPTWLSQQRWDRFAVALNHVTVTV